MTAQTDVDAAHTTAAQQRRAEAAADLAEHSMYELLGGESGLRALSDRFYDLMESDETLAPVRTMHQRDLAPMRLSLFEFLSGWVGGPPLYVQRHGSPCLTEAHAPFVIGTEARDLWVRCIEQAMLDVGVQEKYRELLLPAMAGMAEMMRNAD